MSFFEYLMANMGQIIGLLIEHIRLTAIAVGLAILLGVPLGIFISYAQRINKPVLAIANVIQAIPSMALLGFMIPAFGIGTIPAVVAVVLYSLLPIIKNTFTGIDNINPQTLEAAKGIGLTPSQILFKIQIPLALPVIMAGVRIASVTAVGLMTMAAFIGAGGLGYLVFSGIRTVNNNQILAGAIPACILALLVDFLIGIVENLVTPVSLQGNSGKGKSKKKLYKTILIVAACAIVVLFAVNAFRPAKQEKNITISGIDFTEQEILMNMLAELIESNTDISVTKANLLGGTSMCIQAMERGDIDLYVEYSGTGYVDVLKHPTSSDMQHVYDTVKKEFKEKYNIDVLEQMKFNNTYVMAVTKETAAKYNLTKISDLKNVSQNMVSGTTYEFMNREDGLLGLQKKYNLRFKENIGINGSLRYTALDNNEINITSAFATDGLLKKFDLVCLEDDKSLFPPYYAIPLVRGDVAEKYPEIVPLIAELGQLLTDDVMVELNYQVDEMQKAPSEVATQFLKAQGLIH